MKRPSPNIVYLGLGSNLNDPAAQITRAIAHLAQLAQSTVLVQSSFYANPALLLPEQPQPQPDFINVVVKLATALSPEALLKQCQQIELTMGRSLIRERWAARIIDIDILLYGNLEWVSERLIIPHPELKQRLFVLIPLAELAPELRLPDGTSLQQLLLHHDITIL